MNSLCIDMIDISIFDLILKWEIHKKLYESRNLRLKTRTACRRPDELEKMFLKNVKTLRVRVEEPWLLTSITESWKKRDFEKNVFRKEKSYIASFDNIRCFGVITCSFLKKVRISFKTPQEYI